MNSVSTYLVGDEIYAANLAFSQSGEYMAMVVTTATKPKGIKIMKLSDNGLTDVIFIHSKSIIYKIALSPDGQKVAAYIRSENKLKIWDTTTGKKIETFVINTEDYFQTMLYTDQSLLLGLKKNKTITVYSYITKNKKFLYNNFTLNDDNKPINFLEFSNKGMYLAAGSGNEVILISLFELFDKTNPVQYNILLGGSHTELVTCLAFSSDEKYIVSGSDDKTVRLWSPKNEKENSDVIIKMDNAIKSVTFSPDNNYIMAVDLNNNVKIYDRPHKTTYTTNFQNSILNFAFSPDSKYMVIQEKQSILFIPLNFETSEEEGSPANNEGGRKKTRRRRRRGARRSHQRTKRKTFKKARKITRKRI